MSTYSDVLDSSSLYFDRVNLVLSAFNSKQPGIPRSNLKRKAEEAYQENMSTYFYLGLSCQAYGNFFHTQLVSHTGMNSSPRQHYR